MRTALLFVTRLHADGQLAVVARVRAELYGSLGATGKCHGTDKGVMLGLMGEAPDTVDPDRRARVRIVARPSHTALDAGTRRRGCSGWSRITIDLMFNDVETYQPVRDSGVLTEATLAPLYDVERELVRIIPFDRVRAIKITLPRRFASHGSGSAFDRDVYGAQQHGPLVDLVIP